MKKSVFVLPLLLIFVSGCKVDDDTKKLGLNALQAVSQAASGDKTINVSSTTITSILRIAGLDISGTTVQIKVLEQYDKPIIEINVDEMYFSKSIPSNAKITKINKKYLKGELTEEKTEILVPTPIVPQKNWDIITKTLLSAILILLILVYRRIGKK